VMAVFGAPYPRPDDADNAVRVAAEIMEVIERVNGRRALIGHTPIGVRIGISSGEVVAGNIGSPKRMDYTVIGDAVNIASRLEAANKLYGTRVLISQSTHAELSDPRTVRLLDRMRVKGSRAPIDIYEVLDTRAETEPPAYAAAFDAGIDNYRQGRWERARAAFEAALEARPHDRPAALYLERLRGLDTAPPDSDSW
jgi:adenylate cyclase